MSYSISGPISPTSILGFCEEKFRASEEGGSLAGIPPLYLNLRIKTVSFYLPYVLANNTVPWKTRSFIFLRTLLRHKCSLCLTQTQVNPPRQCLPWSKEVAGGPKPMELDILAAESSKTVRQVLQRLVMISWPLLSSPHYTPSSFP